MVSIGNLMSLRYSNNLYNSSIAQKKIMDEIVTGRRKYSSVIDKVMISKALEARDVNRNTLKKIGYIENLLNTAVASLNNIRDQLSEAQTSILLSQNMDESTRKLTQLSYSNIIQNIVSQLYNTQFLGKKLFDGTFADTSGGIIDAHLLPRNASALTIDYSNDYNQTISIPRLLPGDGRPNNASVDDTFMPLFSVTNNTYNAIRAAEKIPKTTKSGSEGIAEQRKFIEEALLTGVSAEQDIIKDFIVQEYEFLRTRITNPSVESINICLSYSIAALFVRSYSYIDKEKIVQINSMIQETIYNKLSTIDTTNKALRLVNTIPHNEDVNIIQRALGSIMYYIVDKYISPVMPGYNLAQTKLKNAIRNIDHLVEITINSPFPAELYTGSIFDNQIQNLDDKITSAINTLDKVLSSLTSQKNILDDAKLHLQVMTAKYEEIADEYSKVDYSYLITNLLALLRKDKVVHMIYLLEERRLNSTLELLMKVAPE